MSISTKVYDKYGKFLYKLDYNNWEFAQKELELIKQFLKGTGSYAVLIS